MSEFQKEYERAPKPAAAPEPVAPAPEPAPDAKDAEIAALKGEMAQKEAAFDARFSGLERMVGDSFRNRNAPTAPAPPDTAAAYVAARELGLSDEEILANPVKSFEKIRDHLRVQIKHELAQEYGETLQNLTVTAFGAQVDALRSDPYFADLEGALVQYFQDNPNEAKTAGQVRRIYNELIGVNHTELQRRQAARKEAQTPAPEPAPARTRTVEPSFRAPSAPVPEVTPKPAVAALAEDEQAMMDAFNKVRPGLFKDTGEWAEVAEGKRFPKKIASDIQVGRAKSNASQ